MSQLVIPPYPVFEWSGLGLSSAYQPITRLGKTYYLSSGRHAIYLALRCLNIGPGDQVLLPAYNCPSMVEPVRWAGALPVFYRVLTDTTPDLEDLRSRLQPTTRAVIASHNFGFQFPLGPLRTLCDENNLSLIEDCAHVWYDREQASPADYRIGSVRKFFPLFDGGTLTVLRNHNEDVRLVSHGFFANIKSVLDQIEIAGEYDRLPLLSFLLRAVKGTRGKQAPSTTDAVTAETGAQEDVQADEEYQDLRFVQENTHKKMTGFSKLLLNSCNKSKARQRRRQNYLDLLSAFEDFDGVKPLYESLPTDVVPYVFPLFIQRPEIVHSRLKQAGVPMYRWDQFESDVCPVSNQYRYSLIQLPCHQSLRDEHKKALIQRVKQVVGEP